MSGETASAEAGWTVDTLKEHVEALLREKDKAIAAALRAADEASAKAERATEKRFDAVNEFRQTLSDQAMTFMPRLEAEQRIQQNSEKIESINSRLDTTTGRGIGLNAGWGYLVGAVGAAGAIAALLTR